MPAAPRLRQLRRDKTVFSLLMNMLRLQLEEDDRLERLPHLENAPDAELLHIQETADQWLGLAIAYVMRKHHCSFEAAQRVVAELEAQLQDDIPKTEMRSVPLTEVLNFPAHLFPDRNAANNPGQ